MASKLEFVDEVPSNQTGRKSFFDDEVIAELIENEGKWAKVPVSSASAKKFTEAKDFHYKTVTTDKKKKNRAGEDVPVVDVYVTYDPSIKPKPKKKAATKK